MFDDSFLWFMDWMAAVEQEFVQHISSGDISNTSDEKWIVFRQNRTAFNGKHCSLSESAFRQ